MPNVLATPYNINKTALFPFIKLMQAIKASYRQTTSNIDCGFQFVLSATLVDMSVRHFN